MRKIRVRLGFEGSEDPVVDRLAFVGSEARKESFPSGKKAGSEDANFCSKEPVAKVRIAVYDSADALPSTRDLESDNWGELIALAVEETRQVVAMRGGVVPEVALRAVIENLVHAGFEGASVSVLDRGSRVVVADRGPGIPDPEKALQPGFTTASAGMRDIIRGVGSGLGVAREAMRAVGGRLEIQANLGGGAVVVLAAGSSVGAHLETSVGRAPESGPSGAEVALHPRQTQVLLVMADGREVGPSEIAEHVGCSLTTAHRDLCRLEQEGLVAYTARGKRVIADPGRHAVARLLGHRGALLDDEFRH